MINILFTNEFSITSAPQFKVGGATNERGGRRKKNLFDYHYSCGVESNENCNCSKDFENSIEHLLL